MFSAAAHLTTAARAALQGGRNLDRIRQTTNRVANNIPTIRVDLDAAAVRGSDDWRHLNEYQPNTRYELSNGDAFVTNADGQVREVTYSLRDEAGRRTNLQTQVGHLGEAGDEGGHIIRCSDGGTCDRFNLFPENANVNRVEHERLNREIRELHDNGLLDGPVTFRANDVNPVTGRPSNFEIEYQRVDRNQRVVTRFENRDIRLDGE